LKLGPEDVQSIILYDWIIYNKLDSITFHVANERKALPQSAKILERKGVKAGVSDYFVMRPMNPYAGLIIELKIKPNKPTKEQLKFLETMNKEGYLAVVRWSAQEAIETIKDYLMISST